MSIGVIPGTTSSKVAISLPSELHARVKRAADRRSAASFSAYVAQALEAHLNERDFDEMLDATGGPITPDEQAWLDDFFGRTE